MNSLVAPALLLADPAAAVAVSRARLTPDRASRLAVEVVVGVTVGAAAKIGDAAAGRPGVGALSRASAAVEAFVCCTSLTIATVGAGVTGWRFARTIAAEVAAANTTTTLSRSTDCSIGGRIVVTRGGASAGIQADVVSAVATVVTVGVDVTVYCGASPAAAEAIAAAADGVLGDRCENAVASHTGVVSAVIQIVALGVDLTSRDADVEQRLLHTIWVVLTGARWGGARRGIPRID